MAPSWRAYHGSLKRAVLPQVLLDMRAARRFCAARGWSGRTMDRYFAALNAHLDLVPPQIDVAAGLVLDIGANVGGWTATVLEAEPLARVLAVEPSAEARAQLERRFADDPRVRIDARVVAANAGSVDFYLTGHKNNSSLLLPRSEMHRLYPGSREDWQVDHVERLEATTLDVLAAGQHVSVLKIDVQGGELEVLAGGNETLGRTSAVILEVQFVSHYEGSPTFGQIHDAMTGRGFVLAGMTRPLVKSNVALWADACYVSAGSSPDLG